MPLKESTWAKKSVDPMTVPFRMVALGGAKN